MFTPITSTEIESGKPVATTTQNKIKDNFDDHESRIQDLEGGSATIYPPIVLRVNGPYSIEGGLDSILKTTINFNLTIIGARLIIDEPGSSGTTEIDVLYRRGAGSWTSIFTVLPSVAYTEGQDAVSTNQDLDETETDLEAGDLLRLDITSVQDGGKGFMVRLDYERNS